MKKVFIVVLAVYLLSASAIYVRSSNNPCNKTLSYSMGIYDSRFNITQDQFLRVVQEVETVWESPMQKDLFKYDPNAKFKINLVFDDRQQKTIDERELRQKIDLTEESYDILVSQHNAVAFQQKEQSITYEQRRQKYSSDLEAYNNEVAYWNGRGGAPAQDFTRLGNEKKRLDAEAKALEKIRLEVNALVKDTNALAERINEVAKKLNRDVGAYNGKFGTAKQFDQGTYTGESINIYQFNEESDLRLVVAHELGHALKLEHVDDPKSLMYYLMDKQNLTNLHLSPADLDALKNQCRN